MRPHRFDPISASLGIVASAAGLMVAFGGVGSVGAAWWFTLAALLVGIGLVPWSRSGREAATDSTPAVADPALDEPPRYRL